MIEMHLAGVSTRRIEGVLEIIWGPGVSAAALSNLNEKAFASVEAWRNLPLKPTFPEYLPLSLSRNRRRFFPTSLPF